MKPHLREMWTSASSVEPCIPPKANCEFVAAMEDVVDDDALRATDYNFGGGTVPLATFSDTPHDSRSICTAAFDSNSDPEQAVTALKSLGAPVVFSCHAGKLQWWKQTTGAPQRLENIEGDQVRRFFDQHRNDFSPQNIFEGKTLRRLPHHTQLAFVDAGLT